MEREKTPVDPFGGVMSEKQCVFVLGMHRSGTSVLTRALPLFGVDIGSHHLARFDNPKGFFEDPDFVTINEALLHALNTTWSGLEILDLEEMRSLCRGEIGERAEHFLASHPSSFFGLKDPRASLLVPFWQCIAAKTGIQPVFLLSIRHPRSVAESLAKRDNFPFELSYALWRRYITAILLSTQTSRRLIFSYETLLRDPLPSLVGLGHFLKSKIHPPALAEFLHDFLDERLVHHLNALDADCEERCQRLYMMLFSHSMGHEDVFDLSKAKNLLALEYFRGSHGN